MNDVPTLHIRNVPPEVYEELRERARRAGRSLNAEVVDALKEFVRRERSYGFIEQLDAFRREWLAPEDTPKPEEIIREAREERTRRVAGDL